MTDGNDTAYPHNTDWDTEGLTKSELFAAMAMQGVMTKLEDYLPSTIKQAAEFLGIPTEDYKYDIHVPMVVSRIAVRYADALIEALNERREQL